MRAASSSRSELFDAKRRIMAEFLAASEALCRCDAETHAEDLALLLDRRESALDGIRELDEQLDQVPSTDPASEIVAAAALQRTFEAAIDLDNLLRTRIEGFKLGVATSLGKVQDGKKTLGAYRTDSGRVSNLLDKVA